MVKRVDIQIECKWIVPAEHILSYVNQALQEWYEKRYPPEKSDENVDGGAEVAV
jgi:hypothetical protein